MNPAARMLLPDGLTDRRRRVAYRCLILYLIVVVVDLTAEAFAVDVVAGPALVLAMPLLIAVVRISLAPSRGRALLLLALTFAWLGDAFGFVVLVKIVFFLVTQLAYCVSFWPLREHSLLAHRPLALGYALLMTVIIIAMASQAGSLAPAVVLYGALLALMVALASGVNRATGVGAIAFLVSDLALGYQFFLSESGPASAVLAMSTYLIAQLLIVLGLIHREAASRRWSS